MASLMVPTLIYLFNTEEQGTRTRHTDRNGTHSSQAQLTEQTLFELLFFFFYPNPKGNLFQSRTLPAPCATVGVAV